MSLVRKAGLILGQRCRRRFTVIVTLMAIGQLLSSLRHKVFILDANLKARHFSAVIRKEFLFSPIDLFLDRSKRISFSLNCRSINQSLENDLYMIVFFFILDKNQQY